MARYLFRSPMVKGGSYAFKSSFGGSNFNVAVAVAINCFADGSKEKKNYSVKGLRFDVRDDKGFDVYKFETFIGTIHKIEGGL